MKRNIGLLCVALMVVAVTSADEPRPYLEYEVRVMSADEDHEVDFKVVFVDLSGDSESLVIHIHRTPAVVSPKSGLPLLVLIEAAEGEVRAVLSFKKDANSVSRGLASGKRVMFGVGGERGHTMGGTWP